VSIDRITDAEVRALRAEALRAGNTLAVAICDLALRGSGAARVECEVMIYAEVTAYDRRAARGR
jgi:predicted RNA-binding protein with TRAM domain